MWSPMALYRMVAIRNHPDVSTHMRKMKRTSTSQKSRRQGYVLHVTPKIQYTNAS